jgi:hypothetical protein
MNSLLRLFRMSTEIRSDIRVLAGCTKIVLLWEFYVQETSLGRIQIYLYVDITSLYQIPFRQHPSKPASAVGVQRGDHR